MSLFRQTNLGFESFFFERGSTLQPFFFPVFPSLRLRRQHDNPRVNERKGVSRFKTRGDTFVGRSLPRLADRSPFLSYWILFFASVSSSSSSSSSQRGLERESAREGWKKRERERGETKGLNTNAMRVWFTDTCTGSICICMRIRTPFFWCERRSQWSKGSRHAQDFACRYVEWKSSLCRQLWAQSSPNYQYETRTVLSINTKLG